MKGLYDIGKLIVKEIPKEAVRSTIDFTKDWHKNSLQKDEEFYKWNRKDDPKFFRKIDRHYAVQTRDFDESLVHSVNSLVKEGKDISCIYNHENYIEASKNIHDKKNYKDEEVPQWTNGELFSICSFVFIVTFYIGMHI